LPDEIRNDDSSSQTPPGRCLVAAPRMIAAIGSQDTAVQTARIMWNPRQMVDPVDVPAMMGVPGGSACKTANKLNVPPLLKR
jgi:hypothetical protein